MAITVTHLVSNSDQTDLTSYTTASHTVTANALILAAVSGSVASGTVNTPTLTGHSGTWVAINSQGMLSPERKLFLFRTMVGSGSTGTVTLDWGAQTQERASWIIVEATGVDTSGTNGSGAIVQSVIGSITDVTLTLTLAAFGSSDNRPFATYRYTQNFNGTPETGWTELADLNGTTLGHAAMCKSASDDLTASYTYAGGSGTQAGVAVEIKAAAGASGIAAKAAYYARLRRL